eukprot:3086104-Alexandrium_andersonii.AAC.1
MSVHRGLAIRIAGPVGFLKRACCEMDLRRSLACKISLRSHYHLFRTVAPSSWWGSRGYAFSGVGA